MTGVGRASSTRIGRLAVPVARPASVTRRRTVCVPDGGERHRRLRGRRVVVLPVVVEVPGVGQRRAFRVGRAGPVEVDQQGRRPGGGRRADHGRRCLVARGVRDAVDVAALEVDVEEVAVRPRLEVDRVRCGRDERRDLGLVGQAVAARAHEPDAVARVVREEQAVRVGRGVVAALVERDAGDRRAARLADLAGHHLRAVAVGVVRRQQPGRRGVEAAAQREVGALVARLLAVALVARPTGVGDRRGQRVDDPVDLLPVGPADVADPGFIRSRAGS